MSRLASSRDADRISPAPPDGATSLRLGDVVLERASATPSGSPEWQVLANACGLDLAGLPPSAAVQPVVALDGLLDAELLPGPLGQLARDVSDLDFRAAAERLSSAGFECHSLYWGARSPVIEGRHHILWRPYDCGFADGRTTLPLYPVLRHHGQLDEIVLHAAAIAVGSKAVLFLGPSGAGKSTAAANATKAGGRVLSDDGVVITTRVGEPAVLPLPSVATARPGLMPPALERLDLAAFCFLEHASTNRLSPLPWSESVVRLASSWLHEVPAALWLPQSERVRLFDRLRALARSRPSFVLALRPTPAFFPLVARELGLDG